MNNDETYTPCTKCGRPMAYCKGKCCGKAKGCQCKEYCGCTCGVIRPGEPKCPYEAVVPSMVVEHVDSLKDLCDTFVHVSDINTTFYIDDKHRTIITWAGPVEYDNYDLDTNSLGLRSQFLIDFANQRGAYYNKVGNYQVFTFGNGGGVEPLSVTLHFDDSDPSMWTSLGSSFILHIGQGIADKWVEGRELPADSFSFTNDATGDPISMDDIFAVLDANGEVIFNNFPLGWVFDLEGSSAPSINNLKVSSKHVIEDPLNPVTEYSGLALVSVGEVPDTPFGFRFYRYEYAEDPGEPPVYGLIVQGIGMHL